MLHKVRSDSHSFLLLPENRVEDDSRFSKCTLLTLKDRKEGSKILMEIAQNLQELRQMDHLPAQAQVQAHSAVAVAS